MKSIHNLDLHMHTTISDGTDSPEMVLVRVKEAGIDLFSVTDHDAVRGCQTLLHLRRAEDPAFLPGVEFSCRDELGQYHILGYGYEPEAEAIHSVVDLGHSFRMNKVKARLDFLKTRFGFEFPEDELKTLLSMPNPGKPHIGNLMVKFGYAETKEQAIRSFINQLHFRSEYVRPEQAIRGILDSGGIPVLAHPSYGSGDQLILGEEMDRRIRRLMDFGLQGLEGFYSGFTAKLRSEILDFARKYELYVTAGSDYHGSNKLVRLGDTGLSEAQEWPEGLKRFLEEVPRRS